MLLHVPMYRSECHQPLIPSGAAAQQVRVELKSPPADAQQQRLAAHAAEAVEMEAMAAAAAEEEEEAFEVAQPA